MPNRRTGAGEIPRRKAPPEDERPLVFSFKFLDSDHDQYGLSRCCEEYMRLLVRTMYRYSGFTVGQFTLPDHQDDPHRHQIDFGSTVSPNGFDHLDPVSDDLWTDEAWQFSLSSDSNSPARGYRVHGFIGENVFYIVWLDQEHALFPDGHPRVAAKKHGKKKAAKSRAVRGRDA